jgi:16S rRNA (guanine966-N2)-methyltransferase
MAMRVTGGTLSGRRIRVPPKGVRPSADRVRESLFMVLSSRLAGARVLDLFAGTGALGIEALSRGAESCVFVELSMKIAALLRANVRELGLESRSRVETGPADRWIRKLAGEGKNFDLILVDPPYRIIDLGNLLGEVDRLGLLAADGLIAWEHDRRAAPPPPGFYALDERRYGDTTITLLETAESAGGGSLGPGDRR